ncbi:putative S-adenosylmethionine-dependent methyltransferase CRG1 [Zancudomyces culisetae]|uniref:Putative S-adenosylmethionine-dependent methyltransferase CRG1 n=1 Tax=Zancudomyces culisetae TaxID=1213189 RepID=A0A1R1PXD5_ZANCU|nr:putative S-adenosylmethionine-dependent methyltransferase CRG1 [Zancudomyces culisetae]|eukprot:OMH85599.1 putative S-adenosylmethionine-dependent methyltransferase CRG1 [Zancudomyces culisetae]
MSTFKQGFYNYSGYATDRPRYNPQVVQHILKYHNEVDGNQAGVVVDAATGTGILAEMLVGSFDKVIGTDISEKMLEEAKAEVGQRADRLEYRVESAENMKSVADNSIDVITVGTGAHWFNIDAFIKESRRILKPHGTLAIMGYSGYLYFKDFPECNDISKEYGTTKLGKYWDSGRVVLDNLYSAYSTSLNKDDSGFSDVKLQVYPEQAASLTFGDVKAETLDGPIVIDQQMTWHKLLNKLKTWSCLAKYHQDFPNERNVAEVYVERMMEIANQVGCYDQPINVTWEQSIVLARKN